MRWTLKVMLLVAALGLVLQPIAQGLPADRQGLGVGKGVWIADQGDGTYRNPILYADYSDPDAVRVGDDFYMTASSFNCIPGLPILHSKDLVNWTIIGHALPVQSPEEVYDKPQHGNGVWAPAIRFHGGHFYIYYPDPDFGIYVVTAKNPAGPWSKPVLVVGGRGLIDPCPLFEDDGKGGERVWLINGWAASRAEVNSMLTIRPLDGKGLCVTGEGRMVYDGHDRQPTLEGPKLYKRNGYYYIFAPAGGVVSGWQLVLRSRNIYGPYEEKIVMDRGTTTVNGPHQGAWVETRSGASWFLHFQDRGAYGRILHLEPMQWIGDWPVIGVDKDGDGKGEPVAVFRKPDVGGNGDKGRSRNGGEGRSGNGGDGRSGNGGEGRSGNTGEGRRGLVGRNAAGSIVTPAESDEFNGDRPGLQWQWHANSRITWMAEIPGSGFLRLFPFREPAGSRNLWDVPNLLLQKFPAPNFSATTRMRLTADQAGKQIGLLIMGGDYAYLSLRRADSGFALVQVVCVNAEKGGDEVVKGRVVVPGMAGHTSDYLYCRVEVRAPDAQCFFSFSLDGSSFSAIGEPFFAKPDKWIGAKLGLFCLSPQGAKNGGYADVDWFRIEAVSH